MRKKRGHGSRVLIDDKALVSGPLGRTYDKCRALLWGNIGEYHFDCPLDNMLFGWKGVKGDEFKAEVEGRERRGDGEMAR